VRPSGPTARQLGFASVSFVKADVNRYFPVRLAVRGEPATLEAGALVSVIRRTLTFRRCDRLMVDLTEVAPVSQTGQGLAKATSSG
jgi:hypothetical protein